MKTVIGYIIMALGLLTLIFGTLIITIWAIYDIIMNFGTLTGVQIFRDIVWFLCRDVISIIFGFGLIFVGDYLRD